MSSTCDSTRPGTKFGADLNKTNYRTENIPLWCWVLDHAPSLLGKDSIAEQVKNKSQLAVRNQNQQPNRLLPRLSLKMLKPIHKKYFIAYVIF